MALKKVFRKIGRVVKKSDAGLWLFNRVLLNMGNKSNKKYSDYEFLTNAYKNRVGEDLNLKNPQRYSEKLQYMIMRELI